MTSIRVSPRPLVFALAWQGGAEPIGEKVAAFTQWLSDSTGRRIVPRIALSYMELARMVTAEEADLAWLPPVVFVHLESQKEIAALVRNERDGSDTFQSALFVRSDSPIRSIDTLRGSRVAWVDRWSASGHVIPRAILTSRGHPPQLTFREERFFGSHDAVVHAILSGRADVGATFARVDTNGVVQRGGWSHVKDGNDTRVIATFGTIPGDVIGARVGMDEQVRAAILQGFLRIGEAPEMRSVLSAIFGIERFRAGPTDDYDPLRSALNVGEGNVQGG